MALTSHYLTARCYALLRSDVRANLIRRDTELVIEGFPRSANTYAATAFWIASGKDIGCVHHLHTPVNVEVAVKRGIPAIVLVRDPLNAVISQIQRSPELPAKSVFREYIRFYERIMPISDQVVIASFDVVTSHFDAVVREVNCRFGTSFVPYDRTPENEDRVQGELRYADLVRHRFRRVAENSISWPSRQRELDKPALRREVSERCARELARASALYEQLAAVSVAAPAGG